VSSKVRAGRVLGRCHAALGQHICQFRHSTRRSAWHSRGSCCCRRRCRCEGGQRQAETGQGAVGCTGTRAQGESNWRR
jgi:hypothetical protein